MLPAKLDFSAVYRRKETMIDGLMEIHHHLFQATGTEIVMGEAQFVEPKTVAVTLNAGGTQVLRGDRVFLAVGTRAALPDVPGLADAKPMTHVEVLNLQRLPQHLVILGGGYIGLEFAQAMRRFGSQVTLLERNDRLLGREDADVTEALSDLMRDEGVEVLPNAEVLNVAGLSGHAIQLQVRSGAAIVTIEATDILVATGRTPNSDRLHAQKAGIELDSRGYIRVDEKLQTTAPDVWAMGECAGSPFFTHVSFDDYRIVRDNLAGGNRTTRNRLISYCLFTDPELAHVGLSQSQAAAQHINYRLAKLPMANVLRTRTLSETRGFMNALIGDDDRILGFTAFGVNAGEVMAVVQTAMLGKMPYTDLRDTIFTHPTIAEGLTVLFSAPPAAPR